MAASKFAMLHAPATALPSSLAAPDFVLPAQFHCPAWWGAPHTLWAAVFEQCMRDLRGPCVELRDMARGWIVERSLNPGGFDWVCHHLRLDVDTTASALFANDDTGGRRRHIRQFVRRRQEIGPRKDRRAS